MFKDKIAIVTGGATGIGKSCVHALQEEGAVVILIYNHSEIEALDIERNLLRVDAIKTDVTNEEEIKDLFKYISNTYSHVDFLINNAGGNISFFKTNEYPVKDWIETFNRNSLSVFLMCKYAIPLLNDKGKIVNISSISGKTGGAPGGMAYAAAKAAVDSMTKSLAKELAYRKINVNAVSPGVIWTNQHKKFSSKEYYESLIKNIPLGRDGSPNDIAKVVKFLCSDDSSYITGQIIEVNGGQLMK